MRSSREWNWPLATSDEIPFDHHYTCPCRSSNVTPCYQFRLKYGCHTFGASKQDINVLDKDSKGKPVTLTVPLLQELVQSLTSCMLPAHALVIVLAPDCKCRAVFANAKGTISSE